MGGVALLAAQTNAQTLINGAGSTFDYPAFTKWFEAYGKVIPTFALITNPSAPAAGRSNCSTRPWILALPMRR